MRNVKNSSAIDNAIVISSGETTGSGALPSMLKVWEILTSQQY